MPLEAYQARPRGQIGQWDVTADDGTKLTFNSFLGIEFHDNAKVSEEALEKGTFSSYNKTESSGEAVVKLGMSNAIDAAWIDIAQNLDHLSKLKKNPTKLTVVTPDHVLTGYTLEAWSYSRVAEDGVGVLFVELKLREVREIGDVTQAGGGMTISKVKRPGNASTIQRGTVGVTKDESLLFKFLG